MSKCVVILPMVVSVFVLGSVVMAGPDSRHTAAVTAAAIPTAAQQLAGMPMAFTRNDGQWDERVLYRTSAGGATVWFCRDGIYYQFIHRVQREDTTTIDPLRMHGGMDPLARGTVPDSVEMVVVHAAFESANQSVEVTGTDRLDYRCNYFLGNDHMKWRTDVPNYNGVVYRDIYPGIDVHFEGQGGLLNTRYEAKPGADLSQVQFRYGGNATVTLTDAGALAIAASWGTLMQSALYSPGNNSRESYQSTGGTTYNISSSGSASVTSGVTLVYSTYLGGSGDDVGQGIAVDGSGSVYVTGHTGSTDFPNQNPLQAANAGDYDAFVTKLSATGTALVYSTYLGGNDFDYGSGIAVDGSGSVYVTGYTYSFDFPTTNPLQATNAGDDDAFAAKLSASGAALVYSTYLGGSSSDQGFGIALDGSGSAYVTGQTASPDFPIANPLQAANAGGYSDVFVTKLSASEFTLVYSTYLGGGGDDRGLGIAVDGSGSAYVTGHTYSPDFPTANPLQAAMAGNHDAFVTKLSGSGFTLVYSTYLGGSDGSTGLGIAVDGSGSVYVTGQTYSTNFPTATPLQAANAGSADGFVTKLNASGAALVYSTYLGGRDYDLGSGIAVDRSGGVYVTGQTYSTNFPTATPLQSANAGSVDGFVTKLSASGFTLVYSTYLGGSGGDYVNGIAVDGSGSAYVTGYAYSTDFPAVNSYQTDQGGFDAFATKFGEPPCACDCHADPANCDHMTDVLDVAQTINVAFGGFPALFDPSVGCPYQTTDVDCSNDTGVLDVVRMINVTFRGMNAATEFCNPCP